jgi:hypothetical protein
MCHHVHVRLSADEEKSVKKLSGVLIPAYASIVLALLAATVFIQQPRQSEMVASAAPAASQHPEHARQP